MQTKMIDECQPDIATDEELIDVLIAISVIAKRLANNLREKIVKKEENPSE